MPDSIPVIRGDAESDAKRQDGLAKHVKDIPLEGVYEVVEEIRPDGIVLGAPQGRPRLTRPSLKPSPRLSDRCGDGL